jgi:hypothetical protein
MSYHRPDFTPPQPHFAAAPMAYYSTAARKTGVFLKTSNSLPFNTSRIPHCKTWKVRPTN